MLARALPVTLAAVCGCFAVTDIGSYRVGVSASAASGGASDDPTQPSTLVLTLRGMSVHLTQRMEFRVVDSHDYVQARGIVEPFAEPPSGGVTFHLGAAIPADNGPYRLDLYADVNGSGDYDGIPGGITSDHAWRIEPLADYPAGKVAHLANVVQVTFTHNTQFTDIDEWDGKHAPAQSTGADVRVRFPRDKMSPFRGRLLELRVVQASAPLRTVALYRDPELPDADVEAFIPGVVEVGDRYAVEVYVDANGNGAYDNPAASAGDRGWRIERKAEVAGASTIAVDLDFDPSAPSAIDVGAP